MSLLRLDQSLLGKIKQKTGKPEQYVREQISKRANNFGISSEAYLVVWAKNLGLGTASYQRLLSPHIQMEIRSILPFLKKKRRQLTSNAKSQPTETLTIQRATSLQGFRFKNYDLHPEIKRTVLSRFNSKQYADAVEAAFKLVIKRVKEYIKEKTGEEIDGDPAMNRAFGIEKQDPLVKVNNLILREERDEQKGIMFLFKGVVGIRNRKAHDNVILDDPYRAMEYLTLASLLMRFLDDYAI